MSGGRRWVRIAALCRRRCRSSARRSSPSTTTCTSRALIDARLHGERERVLPRIFARPLELRRGQSLTDGSCRSAQRSRIRASARTPTKPGEFAARATARCRSRRAQRFKGQLVRASFQKPRAGREARRRAASAAASRPITSRSRARHARRATVLTLDTAAPDVADRAVSARSAGPVALRRSRRTWCRRCSRSRTGATTTIPGVDPIGMVGAVYEPDRRQQYRVSATARSRSSWRGTSSCRSSTAGRCRRRAGRSTRRKVLEMWVSLVLTRRASKDEILEMYLNDVPLGQRGSFAIHRRRRSGAAVLRQGRHQPDRSPKRRRSPASFSRRRPVAVRQPERGPRTSQRRAPRDGLTRDTSRRKAADARVAGTAHGRAARARKRGALLRRLGQADARRSIRR